MRGVTRKLAALVVVSGVLAFVVASWASPAERWTKDNVNLLARAVMSEAGGEPYVAQVAVAAVILKRAGHEGFPDDVAGVVFQPGAFESVSDGRIWRGNPSEEAWKAARDALNGWDPTNGALYYFDPARTTNPFMWARPAVARFGRFIFAR